MVDNGDSCADWTPMFTTKCNANASVNSDRDQWIQNKYCQLNCFLNSTSRVYGNSTHNVTTIGYGTAYANDNCTSTGEASYTEVFQFGQISKVQVSGTGLSCSHNWVPGDAPT